MQKSEYRNVWGISQSAIKDFQFKSPKKWKEVWIDKQLDPSKNDDNFTMGSLIDTILFTPEELDKRFYIGEERLPSKAIASIIKMYYNTLIATNKMYEEVNKEIPEPIALLDISMNHISMLVEQANQYCYKDGDDEKCGWNTQWKDETRVKNLVEKGSDYFDSLVKAGGRKVISNEMNLEALRLVEVLRSDSEVRDYFVENEDNKLLFQLEIYINYPLLETDKELPLKGALDIVRFNHKDKTVQIADFKSSYSAFGFINSIKQFGYCDQLSYYDFLLREWLTQYCEGKYCEYKVIPPVNIVIDITDRIPYVYEYDWKDLTLAAEGNKEYLYALFQTHDHNVRIKKGWKKLLDEIGWHVVHQLWDKPKELYECRKIKVNLLNS